MDKKDMLGLINVPTVHKRKLARARTITKAVRRENAVQAIGDSTNKAGFNRMYTDSGLVAASAADLPRATAADLTPIKLF